MSTYTDFRFENNDEDPKFEVGDQVRISRYKNIFVKGYSPNWPDKVFVIKNTKNIVSWTYLIEELNGEEILGTFYEKKI